MQSRRTKFIFLAVLALFVFFFSSDFGLIDVEKTAIITAIAIDKDNDLYEVTAQIAVPEATDTNSENLKTQITAKDTTIGGAIKNLGDYSGWFPKLAFCNLILLGDSLLEDNVIDVLDYFAKSLRVQDSALVALADGKAGELISKATPLDNISAFALQKIMLKNVGFDADIASTDIKTFCVGHYSLNSSALMPIVKVIKSSENQTDTGGGGSSGAGSGTSSSGGGSSSKEDKNNLFDARTTALFVKGKKVGELSPELTQTYSALYKTFEGTSFSVNDVDFKGQKTNYLLSVVDCRPKIKLHATENDLRLSITLKLYCKISDHSADGSSEALSQNNPIPEKVKEKAEQYFTDNINELLRTEKQTGCDFMQIKQKLYRYNHKQYSRYKDNYLSVLKTDVNVSVFGQK
ncbi:MAG: hypothetical protein IJC07_05415 [Clostridia bacterium]|nr:hypothetical protein [Clostridia bacterium]